MHILIIIIFATGFGVIGWSGLQVEMAAAASINVTVERQVGNGLWSGDDATIDEGEQVRIRWRSSNNFGATCRLSVNSEFGSKSSNQHTSGIISIAEPPPDRSKEFAVSCSGFFVGSDRDSVKIYTKPDNIVVPIYTDYTPPTVRLERKYQGEWNNQHLSLIHI